MDKNYRNTDMSIVKTIAWNKGSGNITLRYEGSGTSDITIESDANDLTEEREQTVVISSVEFPSLSVNLLVRQEAGEITVPIGTIFNFECTKDVQQVTLPAGRYKLQCWGASGGGCSNADGPTEGSLGGYSAGILVLAETKTLYIYVGGHPTETSGRGGYNCGGSSTGEASFNNTAGKSYDEGVGQFGCGGGATDICLVTGMDYDYTHEMDARTDDSLLSRFIVAGGGAGAYNVSTKATISNKITEKNYVSSNGEYGGGETGGGTYGGGQTQSGSGMKTTLFGTGRSTYTYKGDIHFGASGSGWYGGGLALISSATTLFTDVSSGGGSGFVNIPDNSDYRPSGYTGLELELGKTYGGNMLFESPTGGTETGHSGDGYVRITRIAEGDDGGLFNPIYNWEAQSGTWTESSNSSAADGKQFTSSTPASIASTVVMRFTFENVKKLTFMCKHTVTNNTREYLLVGKLDTAVGTSSYSTSFSGVASNTWKEVTIEVSDTNQHYIEFAMFRGLTFSSSCKADVYLLSIE